MNIEQQVYFNQNRQNLIPTIEEKVSGVFPQPDFEGCQVAITQIDMPMFMTDRVFVNLYYEKANLDGSFEYVNSSRGNEELLIQHADFIQKFVVANTIVDYRKVSPNPDGSCDWEAVLCVDIKGSIPPAL